MSDFFKKVIKENDEETILIGAKVPISVSQYVNLFCAADSSSKTSIIRPLIEAWAKDAKKQYTEKDLIKMTAELAWKEWKERKRKTMTFNTAIAIQRRTLTKKGLKESVIDKIIEKVRYEKDKEAKAKANKFGRPS